MIETVQLELCPACVQTVILGKGEIRRVNLLWRKFQGGLTVLAETITTFRSCGACGERTGAILYPAIYRTEYPG